MRRGLETLPGPPSPGPPPRPANGAGRVELYTPRSFGRYRSASRTNGRSAGLRIDESDRLGVLSRGTARRTEQARAGSNPGRPVIHLTDQRRAAATNVGVSQVCQTPGGTSTARPSATGSPGITLGDLGELD